VGCVRVCYGTSSQRQPKQDGWRLFAMLPGLVEEQSRLVISLSMERSSKLTISAGIDQSETSPQQLRCTRRNGHCPAPMKTRRRRYRHRLLRSFVRVELFLGRVRMLHATSNVQFTPGVLFERRPDAIAIVTGCTDHGSCSFERSFFIPQPSHLRAQSIFGCRTAVYSRGGENKNYQANFFRAKPFARRHHGSQKNKP
jgi:hypothetical protein